MQDEGGAKGLNPVPERRESLPGGETVGDDIASGFRTAAS